MELLVAERNKNKSIHSITIQNALQGYRFFCCMCTFGGKGLKNDTYILSRWIINIRYFGEKMISKDCSHFFLQIFEWKQFDFCQE